VRKHVNSSPTLHTEVVLTQTFVYVVQL